MSFLQTALSCEGHDECTVIVCTTDADIDPYVAGDIVWRSHLHSDIHATHRINPDHPAVDHEGNEIKPEPWCDDCLAHPAVPGAMRGGA